MKEDLEKIEISLRRIEDKLDKYTVTTVQSEEKLKQLSGQIKLIFSVVLAVVTAGASYIWSMITTHNSH